MEIKRKDEIQNLWQIKQGKKWQFFIALRFLRNLLSHQSVFLWNKFREWQMSSLPSYLPEMIEAFVYLSGANDDFSLSDMQRPWCLNGEPRALRWQFYSCAFSPTLSRLKAQVFLFLSPGITQIPAPPQIQCLLPSISRGHDHLRLSVLEKRVLDWALLAL